MDCEVRDLIIMGTGPAGYTAAIYTGRANLKPFVIEGFQPGGQLMITTEIENFPGFPEGIRGPELMGKMRDQATKFGAEFASGSVTEVDLSRSPFCLTLEDGREYFTRALIVATGIAAKAYRLARPVMDFSSVIATSLLLEEATQQWKRLSI